LLYPVIPQASAEGSTRRSISAMCPLCNDFPSPIATDSVRRFRQEVRARGD